MATQNIWPFIISVEGNIGSGKSTILKALRERYTDIDGVPVVYVDEPVTQWEQIKSRDGKNMIELFYSNPSKYAFSFQMMAYISRLAILKEAIRTHSRCVIITERCLLTDYNIFASMLHEQGSMLDEEFAIYDKWFKTFQNDIPITSLIYIKCEPTTSFTRCKSRARVGEDIPLNYLTQCNDKHETWMNSTSLRVLTVPNEKASIDEALTSITNFISELLFA
jgi:deoxyguanosine kinase